MTENFWICTWNMFNSTETVYSLHTRHIICIQHQR